MDRKFWNRLIRSIVVIVVVFLILYGSYVVLPYIYPFLIGLLFAYMFNPLVGLLASKAKFPRWLGVLTTIVLFLSVISTLVTLLVLQIVAEINRLQDQFQVNLDEYILRIETFILQDLVAFYDQFTAFYSSLDQEVQRNIENYIATSSSQLVERVSNTLTSLLEGTIAFIGALPLILTALIISLLASFFISKDWHKWREKFSAAIPDKIVTHGLAVLSDLRHALFGFVKAQLTLISITFVIVLSGLMILRVEYALTIALILGFVDLLPYLGTGLVFVPWIIYLFFDAQMGLALGLLVLYAVVVVQRQMVEPKILGDNVGLDPLTTLIALFVGFSLFGILGLIIGPVIMVILGALHRAGVFKDTWRFIKEG